MAQGYLQVDVVSDANSFPVQDADIVVARTEEPALFQGDITIMTDSVKVYEDEYYVIL